ASFLRNINGAGVDIASHDETLDFLFNDAAEIPYDTSKNTDDNPEPVEKGEQEDPVVAALQEELLRASLEYLKDD
ncbi:MAG: hypothetical protein HRT63_13135, partial [Erythrobacter sp.]|nr:hypothetical protein [Erythrobacter sp.]